LKTILTILATVAAAALAHAQSAAPAKVATIHVQNAIMGTKEGQKAAEGLQSKFAPRRQTLEKRQSELQNMQSQVRAGAATMSQAAKDKLARDIDTGTKALQRDSEDFDSDVREEESKLMSDLGQKMMDIVQKRAQQNGIAIIFDVSNPQSPVLWADAAIDITAAVVKLYDDAHPLTTAAPAPATAPAAPPASPITKKQ